MRYHRHGELRSQNNSERQLASHRGSPSFIKMSLSLGKEASLAKHKEHQGRELGGREDAYVIMRQGTATQMCRDCEMQAGLRGQGRVGLNSGRRAHWGYVLDWAVLAHIFVIL